MVLKLYGYDLSPPTQVVGIVLHEKKIPFEFIHVAFETFEQKKPEHVANQPFGKLPYLVDDDGFVLYDSRAMARYLDAKYPNQGAKLVPTDPKKLAIFDQASFTEAVSFDTMGHTLVEVTKVNRHYGRAPDQEKFNEMARPLDETLDGYEKILSKHKYLAGDELTVVDLVHIPLASLFSDVGYYGLEERPHVANWFHELSERESWLAVRRGVKSTV